MDPFAQLALAARRQMLQGASSPVTKGPQYGSFVDRNRMDRRQLEQRSPEGKRAPDYQNGKWRNLDLTPKNASNGKARSR